MAFGGSLAQSSVVPSWSIAGVTPALPLRPPPALPLPGQAQRALRARDPAAGPLQWVRRRGVHSRLRDRADAAQAADVDLDHESTARREAWKRRVLALAAVAGIAFVGLLGQLWYLQVLEGGKLQEMSERNRIR